MTRQITQNEWTKNIKNTTYQLPQTQVFACPEGKQKPVSGEEV